MNSTKSDSSRACTFETTNPTPTLETTTIDPRKSTSQQRLYSGTFSSCKLCRQNPSGALHLHRYANESRLKISPNLHRSHQQEAQLQEHTLTQGLLDSNMTTKPNLTLARTYDIAKTTTRNYTQPQTKRRQFALPSLHSRKTLKHTAPYWH